MKNRDGFYKMISGYLNKGTLSPVFDSETLAVLRVADSFYIASDYTQVKSGYIAFLVNSMMIRAMMLDRSFLEHLMETSDHQTLSTMMFELDQNTFNRLRKASKDNPFTDLRYSFVDEKMEQWIFDTYGKPDIQIQKPEKKGFFGLFRK